MKPERLLIYSQRQLSAAEVDHQLARVIALLAELPNPEGEERTWTEAEILAELGGEK
jgi:hypothetical protein